MDSGLVPLLAGRIDEDKIVTDIRNAGDGFDPQHVAIISDGPSYVSKYAEEHARYEDERLCWDIQTVLRSLSRPVMSSARMTPSESSGQCPSINSST